MSTTDMSSREKAYWITKTNPYKGTGNSRYLWDAWREGARAFWEGSIPEYRGNSRERAAFTKGYNAAKEGE